MLPITTNVFALTSGEYFRLSLFNLLRRRIVFYLLLAALVRVLLLTVEMTYLVGLAVFAWTLALLIFRDVYTVYNRVRRGDQDIFQPTWYEIYDDALIAHIEGTEPVTIPFESVIAATRVLNYYLLYVNRRQFVCIPYAAFVSQENLDSFDALLVERGLLGTGFTLFR